MCAGQARLIEEAEYVGLDDVAGEAVPETETTVFDDITKVKSKFS